MKIINGLITTSIIVIVIHAIYQGAINSHSHGLLNTELILIKVSIPAALIFGTITGILTSIVLDGIRNGDSIKNAINKKNIIISCVISPIIVGGFYEKIVEIDSFWIVMFLSHQNGFFWESVSVRAGKQ